MTKGGLSQEYKIGLPFKSQLIQFTVSIDHMIISTGGQKYLQNLTSIPDKNS